MAEDIYKPVEDYTDRQTEMSERMSVVAEFARNHLDGLPFCVIIFDPDNSDCFTAHNLEDFGMAALALERLADSLYPHDEPSRSGGNDDDPE